MALCWNVRGLLFLLLTGPALGGTGENADVIVSSRGDGHAGSIQHVLDSLEVLPARPFVILLRNGLYMEQVFVRRSHITLVGEDRDSTRIVFPVLREDWNRTHGGSDWGAGVVNIDTGTTDVTLANLTVHNNHGALYGTHGKHQFAVRGAGTRIMILHCTISSDGGDALSLWNRESGMYYHADCFFSGWVDYVCPRGWCYVTDSRFFGYNTPSASIWHDGSADRRQKFVIANSSFDGVAGFPLGRNHLDGQFYLIGCRFSANMADRPFYRPRSSPREWQWGARHYFHDCHRDGGDFPWFRDNIHEAEGDPDPSTIDARWTFDGQWDPEGTMRPVLPFASRPKPGRDAKDIDPDSLTLSWIPGRTALAHLVYLGEGDSLPLVATLREAHFHPGPLRAGTLYTWRIDEQSDAGTTRGKTWGFSTRPLPGAKQDSTQ